MAKKKTDEQAVRVAPLGELRAYTISEHELEKLEQGSAVSDLFTIGLCLLSIAATVLATMLSTTLPEDRVTLFFCSLLIFGIGGAVCTFLGWRLRTSTRELAKQIRGRMPDAPTVQQIMPPTEPPASPPDPPGSATGPTGGAGS